MTLLNSSKALVMQVLVHDCIGDMSTFSEAVHILHVQDTQCFWGNVAHPERVCLFRIESAKTAEMPEAY